jgi:hypothetical protein
MHARGGSHRLRVKDNRVGVGRAATHMSQSGPTRKHGPPASGSAYRGDPDASATASARQHLTHLCHRRPVFVVMHNTPPV